ncbi:MAG: hypothetical protein R3A12_03820 [Ignavibacteria bacterium]
MKVKQHTHAKEHLKTKDKLEFGFGKIYNLIRALAYPFTGAFCVHKVKYVIRKAESGKNE